jgi:ABC-type multidrug transport system permease subunit
MEGPAGGAATGEKFYSGAGIRTGAEKNINIISVIKEAAAKKNLPRYWSAFIVMCALCFFTSSLALFAGSFMKRAESADVLIVTLGIVMAIIGGTVIPYPYMPEFFQKLGPFSFNRWAQGLIASAMFGGSTRGGEAALAAFAGLAVVMAAASAVKNKYGAD